ncbi:MAG: hypothetical protein QXL52_02740 [Nitrososphaerales archaeon]
MRRVALILILIILFPTIIILTQPSQAYSLQNDDNLEPKLLVKKNEVIEAKYSPMGDLISKRISTTFEIYNNSSQSFTVDIIDRVDSINASTLSMLYGTPNPDEVKTFGSVTKITWKSVKIGPSVRIKYQYVADSMKDIPVEVDEKIFINGEPVKMKKLGELYTINANVSDIITLHFMLNNTAQKLYTNKGDVLPPITCIFSATLSEDNFSDLKTEPETNSTSVVAGKSIMTWYVFLKESLVNFTITAKVSEVGPWGEVIIDPVSIQIPSNPSILQNQLERAIDNIDATIGMVENFTNAISGFGSAFSGLSSVLRQMANAIDGVEKYLIMLSNNPSMAGALRPAIESLDQIKQGLYKLASSLSSTSSSTQQSVKELKNSIMDLKGEKEDLEDMILALNYVRNKPYDLEVKESENSQNSEIQFGIWKGYSENSWMIMSAEINNYENYSKMVYGLAIQIKADDEIIQPTRIEVLVSPVKKGWYYPAEWKAFDLKDLKKIGLEYDPNTKTLYIWSMKRLDAHSSGNLLVDWLNRPIRIIAESNNKPEIIYDFDIADLQDHVKIESTESQNVYSIAQPHLLIQNITFVQPPPPPPPTKDWFTIFFEFLQKPDFQLLITASLLAIGLSICIYLIYRRFRKMKEISQEEITTDELIKEIEDMKKILKSKEEQKG